MGPLVMVLVLALVGGLAIALAQPDEECGLIPPTSIDKSQRWDGQE